MKKKSPRKKTVAPKGAKTKRKPAAAKPAARKRPAAKAAPAKVSAAALAKGRALEKREAKVPAKPKAGAQAALAAATDAKPQRNADFPNTYISQIQVSLDDPDHWMTLTWTGPQSAAQETGPFRTSPGAGVTGTDCDNTATSRRSGTNCTPKGTRAVEGFAAHLNSDARAVFVTWFQQSRGIALHYFPTVPRFAASHGCVRIEIKRVAQLVQANSRIGLTQVTVDGTWTKPARQN